jgi:hypothetical protein
MTDAVAERAGQILALCERLTVLVEAELAAVRARAPVPETPEPDEKARLTTAYRQEMMRLKADPSVLAGLAPASKAKLKLAAQRLENAAAALLQEVAALKEIAEGLVQAVAEAVQAARRGPQTYTPAGGYAAARRAPTPVAVNRSA